MAFDYEYFKKEVYALTTIDLNAYKEKQMKRRIDTLIAKHKVVGYDKYIQLLKADKAVFEEFVNYLTINVSEFYRNPDQWEMLDKQIIPELISKFGKNLKIWSAACSTGDEPYSLVMALSRHLPLNQIKIFATDIDNQVIEKAKAGLYSAKSIVSVPEDLKKKYFTTAKRTVLDRRGANLTNALAFKNGCFSKEIKKTNTIDTPVICDMVHFNFGENNFAKIDYEMFVTHNIDDAKNFIGKPINCEKDILELTEHRKIHKEIFERTNIQFENWHNKSIHENVINKFLKCVQHQISICALGKNYAGPYLGIRDVFQQLESSLIWQPEESRSQIIRVLNFILEDGRPPRSITIPSNENATESTFDLRSFIDQGLWIIATVYSYLAFTNDYTILNEKCGYFKCGQGKWNVRLTRSEVKTTVLEHLIRITNYLVSNLDEKTYCLHTLYGDWNDALQGLGKSSQPDKEYGNGVSIMATLQLYLALGQMSEILKQFSKNEELVNKYNKIHKEISKGIEKYATIKSENNPIRIIHGWGEDMSYFVGSFNDYDSKSRISITPNAYYAISGLIKEHPQYKEDIAKNILSLDSKYGLKTFDEPFFEGIDKVGGISLITPGTYENSCAYVHASTFGIMALFLIGYSEDAWRLLEKAMVITHKNPSRSTFVMPNSYCHSEEYSIDDVSTGDWYTGSGTVLFKNIIRCAFGIEPTLSSIKISPAKYFPSKTAEISLKVKNINLSVRYENHSEGIRTIYMNGNKLPLEFDSIRDTYYVELKEEIFENNINILITD